MGVPNSFLDLNTLLLHWDDYSLYYRAVTGPRSFVVSDHDFLFDKNGGVRKDFRDMKQFKMDMLMCSTEILAMMEPEASRYKELAEIAPRLDVGIKTDVAQPRSHSHTMDLHSDEAYLKINGELCRLNTITITGLLQWKTRKLDAKYYIFENAFDQTIYSSSAIADYEEDDGRMFAMILPEKGRELSFHTVAIPEKQRFMLRNLRIK